MGRRRQKGFGYVQFIKELSAEAAVKNQAEIVIRGRPVFVDYDGDAGPKSSFRAPDGKPWAKTKVGKTLTKDTKGAPRKKLGVGPQPAPA